MTDFRILDLWVENGSTVRDFARAIEREVREECAKVCVQRYEIYLRAKNKER